MGRKSEWGLALVQGPGGGSFELLSVLSQSSRLSESMHPGRKSCRHPLPCPAHASFLPAGHRPVVSAWEGSRSGCVLGKGEKFRDFSSCSARQLSSFPDPSSWWRPRLDPGLSSESRVLTTGPQGGPTVFLTKHLVKRIQTFKLGFPPPLFFL